MLWNCFDLSSRSCSYTRASMFQNQTILELVVEKTEAQPATRLFLPWHLAGGEHAAALPTRMTEQQGRKRRQRAGSGEWGRR